MVSVKWKNRSIGELSTVELREALRHAVDELRFANAGSSSRDFFTTVVVSYLAGALTVLVGIGLALKLT